MNFGNFNGPAMSAKEKASRDSRRRALKAKIHEARDDPAPSPELASHRRVRLGRCIARECDAQEGERAQSDLAAENGLRFEPFVVTRPTVNMSSMPGTKYKESS